MPEEKPFEPETGPFSAPELSWTIQTPGKQRSKGWA